MRRALPILLCVSAPNVRPLMITPTQTLLQPACIRKAAVNFIPPLGLPSTSRKGTCGNVAVLGCSPEYSGAGHYAAESALRSGVDLVTLYVLHDSVAQVCKTYGREVMVRSLESEFSLVGLHCNSSSNRNISR